MNVKLAADNMLTLVAKNVGDPVPVQSEHGKGIDGAVWLLTEIKTGKVQGEKAHRWLGYAQAMLVYENVADLEACKYANLFA